MSFAAADLIALHEAGPDRFRAVRNLDNLTNAIFGGQQIGLALAAAQRTVPDWPCHALTGFFERRGRVDEPVELAVERTGDSRRFAHRRVLATQGGRVMFDLTCAFNAPEATPGYGAMEDVAAVPPPEGLLPVRDFVAAHADRFPAWAKAIYGAPFPLELRLVDPAAAYFGSDVAAIDLWFRVTGGAEVADAAGQQALLACLSDYWLAGTASAPMRGRVQVARTVAINHAMWFHAPTRCEEWLLFRTTGAWAGNGRGLAQGRILDRRGRLIATVMQETAIGFAAGES